MAHVTNSLGIGEEIVSKASVSGVIFIVRGVVAAFLLLMGIGGDILVPMIVVALLLLAKPIIAFGTTELAVTNRRVIGKVGFLNTKTMDAPLNKLNNIRVQQRLAGKILNYATICVTTSSGDFRYAFIKNAENFKQTVSRQIEIYDEERIKKQAREMANAMRGVE